MDQAPDEALQQTLALRHACVSDFAAHLLGPRIEEGDRPCPATQQSMGFRASQHETQYFEMSPAA